MSLPFNVLWSGWSHPDGSPVDWQSSWVEITENGILDRSQFVSLRIAFENVLDPKTEAEKMRRLFVSSVAAAEYDWLCQKGFLPSYWGIPRRRRSIPSEARRKVYETFNDECSYCGSTCRSDTHIDHIVPISRGGTNEISNLTVACRDCNLSKANKTIWEWYQG